MFIEKGVLGEIVVDNNGYYVFLFEFMVYIMLFVIVLVDTYVLCNGFWIF